MIRMKKNRLYIVKWKDHFSDDSDWVKESEWKDYESKLCERLKKDPIVKTIGFFLGEVDGFYVFAMNQGENESGEKESSVFMHLIKICVIEIKEVTLKKWQ